ncbi:hypothetical protein D6D02_04841 [Aureobasidium pullulans]|nr:hypothetical protein D6D23_08683 [Aureobasidium pullulans]THY04754.1 hypothetical protein D6D03_03521 [Aureobasidium pullulans]THY13196.1 hypothetical protein D6D02_04841 [Aureobasidium pullulans]
MKGDDFALSPPDMSSISSAESDGDLEEFYARFQNVTNLPNSRRLNPGRSNESGWLDAMYPAEAAAPGRSGRTNSPLVGQSDLTGQRASSQYPLASTQPSLQPLLPSENPTAPRLPSTPLPIYLSGTIRDYAPDSRAPINQRRPVSEANAGRTTSNPRFHRWLRDNWQHTIEFVLPADVEETLFRQWCEEERLAERQQQLELALSPRRNEPTLSEDTAEDPYSFAEMERYLGPEIAAMSIRESIQLDYVPPGPTASRNTAPIASISATTAPTTTTPDTAMTITSAPTSTPATSTVPSTVTPTTTMNTAAIITFGHNPDQDIEEKQLADDIWEF